jgi:hypothetical protein
MSFRPRVFGVLLALIALSASIAEGAWASTCARMEMDAPAGMTMPMDGAGTHPASNLPHRDGAPDDRPDCPVPALASAGCVVVSLPSPTVAIDLPATDGPGVPPGRSDLCDRLAVSTLFRPPQR